MSKSSKSKADERESALVSELQLNHGWMFFDTPRKADRHVMLFRRKIVGGKTTSGLEAGRKVVVAFPMTSPIAVEFEKIAAMKPEASRRRSRR